MSDFRTRLLGLAGAAMLFSGMAFGQNLCQTSATLAVPSGAAFVRAEGQTELIPAITVSCSGGTAAGSANIQLFFSPAVTVTSAIVTSSTGATEAVATANGGGGSAAGIISPGGITFSGITTGAGTTSFTITNIRVDATAIPTTTGAPPTPVSATAFISGTNVTPSNTGTGVAVAYTLNGLALSKEYSTASTDNPGKVVGIGSSSTSFGICSSINAGSGSGSASPNFYVSVGEGFASAFKTATDEASGTSPDKVSFGTRIAVTFTNVPTGLSIYLPTSVTGGGGTLTAVTSGTVTGSNTAPTAATSPAAVSGQGLFFVPASSGSATAYFEVTADSLGTLDTFFIPVTLVAATNSVSAQTSMLTVATSFAPITAATTIPSFKVGSSTVPVGFLSFSPCTTSLLFPFVSNAAGFETGIAISNTTVDPFGGNAQSGTCTLNFYGTGGTNPKAGLAPNPNEGSGKPYAGGETYAFTLTSALAATAGNPATFTGYVIAQCGFQMAHGFAYITYGFPGTSSDTMGYLALVLPRGSTSPESLGQ